MRGIRPRLPWWVAVAAVSSALALGLAHRRVRAMPPPPHVVEPPAQSHVMQAPKPTEVATPTRKVQHVLIISEDGLRKDAVDHLHLHWHDLLRQHGAYALHARTIRDASTLPAHASMLSGVEPREHGLTWNTWRPSQGFIKVPTIFTEAQEHGLTTAFFTGKTKLRHIVPRGTVGLYERPGYYCKKVAEAAAAYLTTEKPALAFVHFSDPDEAGHAVGWMSNRQIKAIGDSDRCLGILYEALEHAHLLEETLIIITADHGGHNRVHSGRMPIDREIPWIACGPGVREDFAIPDEISTKDTAATALYALGLPIPARVEGKPRLEIFTR